MNSNKLNFAILAAIAACALVYMLPTTPRHADRASTPSVSAVAQNPSTETIVPTASGYNADMASATNFAATAKAVDIAVYLHLEDGRLSGQAISALGLNSTEAARLTHVLESTKAALIGLDLKHAKIELSEDKKRLIAVVPAYPEDGAALYNQMNASIADILGPERFSIYDQKVRIPRNSPLHDMGLCTKVFDVVRAEDNQASEANYSVKAVYKTILDESSASPREVVTLTQKGEVTREGLERFSSTLPHVVPKWF